MCVFVCVCIYIYIGVKNLHNSLTLGINLEAILIYCKQKPGNNGWHKLVCFKCLQIIIATVLFQIENLFWEVVISLITAR